MEPNRIPAVHDATEQTKPSLAPRHVSHPGHGKAPTLNAPADHQAGRRTGPSRPNTGRLGRRWPPRSGVELGVVASELNRPGFDGGSVYATSSVLAGLARR